MPRPWSTAENCVSKTSSAAFHLRMKNKVERRNTVLLFLIIIKKKGFFSPVEASHLIKFPELTK